MEVYTQFIYTGNGYWQYGQYDHHFFHMLHRKQIRKLPVSGGLWYTLCFSDDKNMPRKKECVEWVTQGNVKRE